MDTITKARPTALSEFVGNKNAIAELEKISKEKGHVLLLGPSGTGKTLLAEILCSEKHYNTLFITKDNLVNADPFIKNNTIESFFDKRQKALVIDNVEVLINNERVSSTNIISIIKECKGMFVLLTCNSTEEKKVSDLKKHLSVVRISAPSIELAASYIEGLGLPLQRSSEILAVVNRYQGNIRESISQLTHGTCTESISRFRNKTGVETVDDVLANGLFEEDAKHLSEKDASVLSCMLFENLPEEIHFNRLPKDMNGALAAYKEVVARFIDSTVLEERMCVNHDWFLWDYVYAMRFVGIGFALESLPRVSAPREQKVRPSQLLSKISHKQIMGKKLKGIARGLSQENKVLLADVSAKHGYKPTAGDDGNFVSTYTKYFL